jgi:hypothetical protein
MNRAKIHKNMKMILNRDGQPYECANPNSVKNPLYDQPWYYSLPVNCIFKIPALKSELEAQILRKMNWDRFVFQFPPYIDLVTKTKTFINLDKSILDRIEIQSPRMGHERIYPKALPIRTRNTIINAWKRYRTYLGIDDSMQKTFPLFWAILRDSYITNYLNAKNNRQVTKMQKNLLFLLTKVTALLSEMFDMVKENVEPWNPQLATTQNINLLNRVRQFLEPILSPENDPEAPNLLYLPEGKDPEFHVQ